MGVSMALSEGILWDWKRLRGRIVHKFAQAIPFWLVRAGLPAHGIRSVTVSSLPLTDKCKSDLSVAASRGAPVEVSLNPSLFLTKTILLPYAARGSAEAAIALELRQTMPAEAEGLVWRGYFVRNRHGNAEFNVYILKRDQLTKLLRDAGGDLRRVVIQGVEDIDPLIDNRKQVDAPERFWNRATAAACGLALLAALGFQAWHLAQLRKEERTIGAELLTLRAQTTDARRAIEARNAATETKLRDAAMLRSDRQRLLQLADLTRALDDSVWLSSTAINGTTLKLTGFTNSDVTTAVEAIQSLSWVASVDAEGSIVVDPGTGEGRFQLTVKQRQIGSEG